MVIFFVLCCPGVGHQNLALAPLYKPSYTPTTRSSGVRTFKNQNKKNKHINNDMEHFHFLLYAVKQLFNFLFCRIWLIIILSAFKKCVGARRWHVLGKRGVVLWSELTLFHLLLYSTILNKLTKKYSDAVFLLLFDDSFCLWVLIRNVFFIFRFSERE